MWGRQIVASSAARGTAKDRIRLQVADSTRFCALPFDQHTEAPDCGFRGSHPATPNQKEFDMQKKLMWIALSAAVLFVGLHYAVRAWATPASGFVGKTLAKGTLEEFAVFNRSAPADTANGKIWLSFQQTKGTSDLYVQDNTWQPGGTTGWHSHPGQSLIIVTEGTVTDYEANDPACKPHEYSFGTSFVDAGGDHAHIIRNETGGEAKTIAVQLIPAGAPRRIDVANPGNCSF
jgi:quercetin dioxygenase-like cupin family protein